MLRALFKLILLIVVLVGVGGFLLGWWTVEDLERRISGQSEPVGTSGPVSTDRAREVGARAGEVAATAANLDTQQAAVWTRNPDELRERTQLFADWCRRLCGFLGVPAGPAAASSRRPVAMVV